MRGLLSKGNSTVHDQEFFNVYNYMVFLKIINQKCVYNYMYMPSPPPKLNVLSTILIERYKMSRQCSLCFVYY